MAPTRKAKQNYFRFVHPVIFFLVIIGFVLLFLAIINPDKVPSFLGRVGDFVRHLGKRYPTELTYIGVIAAILHVLEAIYGYVLCRRVGFSNSVTVKWFIQTLLFGLFSLRKLIHYYNGINKNKM